jgi:hypothetical protein
VVSNKKAPRSEVSKWLESDKVRLEAYAQGFTAAGLAVLEDLEDLDDEDIDDLIADSGMLKIEGKRLRRELQKLTGNGRANPTAQPTVVKQAKDRGHDTPNPEIVSDGESEITAASESVATTMSMTSKDIFGPQNRIIAACKAGKLAQARDVLEELLQEGGIPTEMALSAMLEAHSGPALPKAFKLLQFSSTVQTQSMPTQESVVIFLKQCLAQNVDRKAITKVESTLAQMVDRGFTLNKAVKRAFRSVAAKVDQNEKDLRASKRSADNIALKET